MGAFLWKYKRKNKSKLSKPLTTEKNWANHKSLSHHQIHVPKFHKSIQFFQTYKEDVGYFNNFRSYTKEENSNLPKSMPKFERVRKTKPTGYL